MSTNGRCQQWSATNDSYVCVRKSAENSASTWGRRIDHHEGWARSIGTHGNSGVALARRAHPDELPGFNPSIQLRRTKHVRDEYDNSGAHGLCGTRCCAPPYAFAHSQSGWRGPIGPTSCGVQAGPCAQLGTDRPTSCGVQAGPCAQLGTDRPTSCGVPGWTTCPAGDRSADVGAVSRLDHVPSWGPIGTVPDGVQ